MMSASRIAVVLYSLLALSRAQVLELGACPTDVVVEQSFDASRFVGTWYEQQKYFAIFQLGGKCVAAEYSLNDDGTVAVHNSQINSLTGELVEIDGTATSTSTTGEAKLSVNFPTNAIAALVSAPYWILATDYDNYAVVWGCNNLEVAHFENAWILTRARNMTTEIQDTAYAVFEANGIDTSILTVTDQTGCE